MKRISPILSQGLLFAGVLLILAGLGWGVKTHLSAPPPPTMMTEGAVVLAVTAPLRTGLSLPQVSALPIPEASAIQPTPSPAGGQPHLAQGPSPSLLPDWAITPVIEAMLPEPSGQSSSAPLPAMSTRLAIRDPVSTLPPQPMGPPSRIVAPAINLDSQVVPMGWKLVNRNSTMVSEWIVPSGAAGWHIDSALPGYSGNVVLSGHHNIEGKVFRHVVDLEMGDEITLYVGGAPYIYNVTEKYILKEAGMPLNVRRQNAQWIMPTGDERLTLVTCWPYEWPGNSHRVIVVARPADWYREQVGGIE